MHRWLFVFLLIVVPLQLTWAAAGGYCEHEQGAASGHFGHHAHSHDASMWPAAGAEPEDNAPPGSHHADCGYCHLSASKAVAPSEATIHPAAGIAAAFALAEVFDSYVPAGLERPDRSAVR